MRNVENRIFLLFLRVNFSKFPEISKLSHRNLVLFSAKTISKIILIQFYFTEPNVEKYQILHQKVNPDWREMVKTQNIFQPAQFVVPVADVDRARS